MKRLLACTTAFALAAGTLPAFAHSDNEKIAAGALAILGIAALLHDKHHHAEGSAPRDENGEAAFEHGYRDGLHGQQYNVRYDSDLYSQGYYAGQKEMTARLSHNSHRADHHRADVPRPAMQACVGQAANEWGTSVNNVHPTKAKSSPDQADVWMLELTAGRHVGVCESQGNGTILSFNSGRM